VIKELLQDKRHAISTESLGNAYLRFGDVTRKAAAGQLRAKTAVNVLPSLALVARALKLRPGVMQIMRSMRRFLERLPPYSSLVVVAVPLAIVEPLKLAAVLVAGDGHWLTGTFVLIGAYAVSLFVTERLFAVVKPKLLTLPWFAAIWNWFVARRGRALALLRRWTLRRKALWMWDDGG
jgi:hypothetical protein